jgi:hypothetical protein
VLGLALTHNFLFEFHHNSFKVEHVELANSFFEINQSFWFVQENTVSSTIYLLQRIKNLLLFTLYTILCMLQQMFEQRNFNWFQLILFIISNMFWLFSLFSKLSLQKMKLKDCEALLVSSQRWYLWRFSRWEIKW